MSISNSIIWFFIGLVALFLGFWAVRYLSSRWYQYRKQKNGGESIVYVNNNPSPFLSWLKDHKVAPGLGRINLPFTHWLPKIRIKWTLLLEVIIIIIWALWVGRAYFNFDPSAFPQGGDFPHEVQGHLFWHLLPQCGLCFLWNGYLDGGSPSFAELQGAGLHPLVAIGSLLWGTINGEKFMLLCSLVMAGLAQWWLARVLGLGWLARLWSGLIIVVCGHLGQNLSNGVTNLVFAIANASLILPPAVDLALNHNRRSIIWLGIALASTVLAGQGYIQIGVLFAVLPALLIFVLFPGRPSNLWKDYLLAGVLAFLLSAYMLVPMLHFYPAFGPEGGVLDDLIQSINTVFLNFVSVDGLKVNYPLFVGLIPVVLALIALRLAPRDKRRLLWFFMVSILLVCALSTRELVTFIVQYIPRFDAVRIPSLISGLAVPFLIGLSAWGLDLLVESDWPKVTLSFAGGRVISFAKTWLILAIPLVAAIVVAYPIGTQWMYTVQVDKPAEVIQSVQTASAQWVQFPTDDFLWAPALIDQGNYKLTNVYRPWRWIGRDQPKPFVEAVNNRDIPAYPSTNLLKTLPDYAIFNYSEDQYAAVQSGSGVTACHSNALGGNIDITCNSPSAGQLILQEYSWSGWYAWMDNKPIKLKPGEWLSVDAQAGKHTFSFRYRPWDVLIGLILTLIGVGLSIGLEVRFFKETMPATS